jgi:hypothetical protein
MTDEALLQQRFCNLGLNLRNTGLSDEIAHLYELLERRGIRFRPHAWISTEWFSPDGIPGIAIPFFAAHPRLAQLERRMRGEAEGGNKRWRRRILYHEAGHALDTAYGLRRRSDWRAVFGRASRPYPTAYSVRPASRRFVLHLGHWYAQSHPTEDFAETFAVWLQPRARWRREYESWPALGKLEYVDALMQEIAGRRPRNRDRSVVARLSDNRRTLREHYRRHPATESATDRRYDAWLNRVFRHRSKAPESISASRFLAAIEPELRRIVIRRTGAGRYLVDHVANTVRRRARVLDLVLRGNQRVSRRHALALHERIIFDLMARNREQYVI